MADVRLRDRRAPRTYSRRQGADGPICARSVPEQGTGTGEDKYVHINIGDVLVSFRVSNFLSFGDTQELQFVSKEDLVAHNERCFEFLNGHILRCMMIFGPNGSGKTNLMFALKFMFERMGLRFHGTDFYFSEKETVRTWHEVNHFNNNPISKLELDFTYNEKVGTYGFEYDSSTKKVISEYFYTDYDVNNKIIDRRGEVVIWENGIYILHPDCSERLLISLIPDNPQYPAAPVLFHIRSIFSGIVLGSFNFENIAPGQTLLEDRFVADLSCLNFIQECLKELADVDSIRTKPIHNAKRLKKYEDFKDKPMFILEDKNLIFCGHDSALEILFHEKGFSRLRSFSELSSGIRRLTMVILMIYSAVENQHRSNKNNKEFFDRNYPEYCLYDSKDNVCLVCIDEFCYSIHPYVAKILLSKFLKKMENEFDNLQLICTAHNTEIMSFDSLRSDEITFVQCNGGQTQLYSLSDFAFIKDHENWDLPVQLNQLYLEGRFGAVPRFKNTE